MKYVLTALSALALCGCTYNISMAHTQGTATDTIDDHLTATPVTDISVPVSLTPVPAL